MEFTQYGGAAAKKKPAKKKEPAKKRSTKKPKKGGNFLGSVSELFIPTGWENFATAAGLLALDRADAALRRGRNSTKKSNKQRGGADVDGHMSNTEMDKYFSPGASDTEEINSSPDSMSDDMSGSMTGGAKKKPAKKKGAPKKKPAAKKKRPAKK